MGRVRKIVVQNKEVFIDILLRELIKNNISYVQIENEIHFLDKIFRIYTFEEAKILQITDNPLINLFDDIDISRKLNKDITVYNNVSDDFPDTSIKNPKYNKQLIKRQNKLTNMKIKSSR